MEMKIPALSAIIHGKGYMTKTNTLMVGPGEGEYAILKCVDFGSGKKGFKVTYCWAGGGVALLEIRLDSLEGKSIGVCACTTIDEMNDAWCEIEETAGVHDVYLVFHKRAEYMDFCFTKESPYEEQYTPVSDDYIDNVMPDTWEATDMLGRKLPSSEECTPKRDKKVGMFYWNWHAVLDGTLYDVPKVLKQFPEAVYNREHPVWGNGAHYWSEPLFGFYRSNDAYVLRKHAVMLAAAGVDFIVYDCTNAAFVHKRAVLDVFEAFRKAKMEGTNVPKITFLMNFGPAQSTELMLRGLYQDIYKPGLYKDLWCMHEGKPLMMAYPGSLPEKGYNDADTKFLDEIRNFFTFRPGQAGYSCGPNPGNKNKDWAWLECMPLHKYGLREDGSCEQMAVGVAQNSLGERDTYFNRPGTRGRSFTTKDGHSLLTEDSYKYGYNFQEQWDCALEADPDVVFVTGWNEWCGTKMTNDTEVGRVVLGEGNPQEVAFYDQYDKEHSRDIEPDSDGILDTCYLQLAMNIRKFKGTDKLPVASEEIKIGEDISWNNVGPAYKNYIGFTQYRNHPARNKSIRYKNDTMRNDIAECRIARDNKNVYFYAKATAPIMEAEAENAMVLYLNLDRSRDTGWEGYEMRVSGDTLEKALNNEYVWEKVCTVKRETKDDTVVITVPKEKLSLGKDFDIEFKWSDNAFIGNRDTGDIMDFYVNGSAAPIGRFNFRYKTK